MLCKQFQLSILVVLNYINFGRSVKLKNNVEIENVEPCPNNDNIKGPVTNLKFTKINQTHSSLSMDLYYSRDIDDQTAFTIRLDRWSDGRWVEWPFLPKQKNMCKTMMKLFPTVWTEINKSMNRSNPDQCPIPAGLYHVENHIFDFSELYAPIRLGRFRATTKVTDELKKEEIYCVICIVAVVQRVNGI